MSRYALVGAHTGDLLTFRGRVIVHDQRHEMEWVFPNSRVVRVADGESLGPTISLKDHPDMASFRWPLRREDFW